VYRNIDPSEQPPPQDDVVKWMLRTFRSTQTVGSRAPSSYESKHVAEKALGRYVSEREFIASARAAGYLCRDGRVGVNRADYLTEFRRVNP